MFGGVARRELLLGSVFSGSLRLVGILGIFVGIGLELGYAESLEEGFGGGVGIFGELPELGRLDGLVLVAAADMGRGQLGIDADAKLADGLHNRLICGLLLLA